MNSQIIEFIEGFEKNPRAESAVNQQVVKALNLDLPSEYLNLFSFMNGGEGFIGDNYCRLYAIENLMPLNEAFLVKEFALELFIFGSNGGGEAFAFNTKSSPFSIVEVPFIPMDLKWAKLLEKTINEYFSHFSNSADNKVNSVPPSINKALIGKEIHEIRPVVFGGDPLDPKNKIPLGPEDYAKFVVFWNRIWQNRKHQEAIKQEQRPTRLAVIVFKVRQYILHISALRSPALEESPRRCQPISTQTVGCALQQIFISSTRNYWLCRQL